MRRALEDEAAGLRDSWSKKAMVERERKFDKKPPAFVPSSSAKQEYCNAVVEGEFRFSCKDEKLNAVSRMSITRFLVHRNFDRVGGGKFGLLAGIVDRTNRISGTMSSS